MPDDGRTYSERMTLADAVCELARTQLGVEESDGCNSGVPIERYAGGRREAWCGHFLAWLFREVGAPLPGDVVPTLERGNPIASVQALTNMCRMQGWRVEEPRRGDLLVRLGRSHIGLVARVPYGDAIQTIAGNTDDAVRTWFVRAGSGEELLIVRPVAPPGWAPPTGSSA